MEGQTLLHYRVLQRLGGGGMGVVYKALDTRLNRPVAVKFLPPEMTGDDEARQRFMQEAQAASALDHPNICTIHEIASTSDGQIFIVMAFYEGETLKRRIERGALSVQEALDVAVQVAQGLANAHAAGIVHRDIKPANLMITKDGFTKILDFGIAKLVDLGHTGITRTGTTLGTVAYMAPEQFTGLLADPKTDVWSLGVVLYEMLAGHLPFSGERELAVVNSILSQTPKRLRTIRPDIPVEVETVVERAMDKNRATRYASAADIHAALARCRDDVCAPVISHGRAAGIWHALRQPRIAIPAAILVSLIGLGTIWGVNRAIDARWAAEEAIPEIERLVQKDDYAAALTLVREVERVVPNNPRLSELWPRVATRRFVDTDPAGADVYVTAYGKVDGPWTYLGRTPATEATLPHGAFRWRIEKPGFDTLEFVATNQFLEWTAPVSQATSTNAKFHLSARGDGAADMIQVPASNLALDLTSYNFNATVPAGGFRIGKYEVTNKQFKQFVDSGGYEKRQYWKHPVVRDGRVIPWEQAIVEFRDRTGRPGPSIWEVGTYPAGEEDYPVGGVSWYEAAAYAEFAGKSLPTIYHWLRAAGVSQAAFITPLSNFSQKGPAPVGRNRGVSVVGAFDMAGNVKEWCWNEMTPGSTRYILGGAWNDPDYQFIFADARSPFDRSETNGFRVVDYIDATPLSDALTRAIPPPSRDYSKEEPVSNEVFQVYKGLYSYDPTPLDSKIESVDDTNEYWRKEKVSFRAAYGNERVVAYLFVPKNVRPPFETLVYFPGSGAIRTPSSETLQLDVIDFLMVSGRAVLYPIYKGTYERNTGQTSSWPEMNRAHRDLVMQQINDARRGLDYLETRADVRHDALGYFGFSWGARLGSLALAVEPRFKAAIFRDGGFPAAKAPPEVDPFNFAPHVSVPVLMLNGASDNIFQVDVGQKPLFVGLGTAEPHKRHLIFPGGHGFSTQVKSQMVRETLDWLDKYLGPVK